MVLAHLGGFIARIGYVYPRFMLPVLLLALPLAARGFSVPPRARASLAALVLVLGLGGGPLVSWVMLTDPRLPAERWLRANLPAGATVEVASAAYASVRVPHDMRTLRTEESDLLASPRGPEGDVVVISSTDSVYLVRDPRVRTTWWDAVHDSAGEYRLGGRFERPFGAQAMDEMWLAPRITIYRRESGLGATP
jgi:hypothetical protein